MLARDAARALRSVVERGAMLVAGARYGRDGGVAEGGEQAGVVRGVGRGEGEGCEGGGAGGVGREEAVEEALQGGDEEVVAPADLGAVEG